MKLRALTFIQPWGSLVMLRVKRFETRSWPPYRGVDHIAIHAGAKIDMSCFEGRVGHVFRRVLQIAPDASEADIRRWIPTSCILGVAKLGEAIATNGRPPRGRSNSNEDLFGNFAPGRFAWPVEPILHCQPPINCKGFQGMWKLPEEIERVLLEAIGTTRATP